MTYTVSLLAAYLVDELAPPQGPEERGADLSPDSTDGVLDDLFDSVESASAGRESGIW